MGIKRSEMLDDGVCVWFDNGWYYAHGIQKEGFVDDDTSRMNTMWAWINHMSHKRWWNDGLQEDFIAEVKKYL